MTFIELAGMLYGNREPSGMLYVRFIELAGMLLWHGEEHSERQQHPDLHVEAVRPCIPAHGKRAAPCS